MRDWMKLVRSGEGVERLEAWFAGHAYDPHRHDSYAIGVTRLGVQAFAYRGRSHASMPGQVMVLHPDEVHDGHAGSEAGFGYWMVYVEPRAVLAALGGRGPLPFVRDAVVADAPLAAAVASAFEAFPDPLEQLEVDQLVVELADGLRRRDTSRPAGSRRTIADEAVGRARALLEEEYARDLSSADLERVSGLDRFNLARHFRARLGVSPHRYLVARRLREVRALIDGGLSLGQAALAAGFSDQSHMTRHFKRTYGLAPGRFARLASVGDGPQ